MTDPTSTPPEPPEPVPPAGSAVPPPEPAPPVAPVAPAVPPPGYGAQPPAYGAQPVGYAPVYVAPNPTNPLAIVSLVASLAGIFIWFIGPVVGIITGHIALSQIKKTGQQGHGMALAGTVVGYVLAGLTVLVVIAYIIFIVVIIGVGATNGYSSS